MTTSKCYTASSSLNMSPIDAAVVMAEEEVKVAKSRRKSRKNDPNGTQFLTEGMLRHELLSKEEENRLGRRMIAARNLRNRIRHYVLEKESNNILVQLDVNENMEEELNELLVNNPRNFSTKKGKKKSSKSSSLFSDSRISFTEEDVHTQMIQTAISFSPSLQDSSPAASSAFSLHMDASLRRDITSLSHEDIVNGLLMEGGMEELLSILHSGTQARRKLVSCNLKLVTSIARTWMRRAYSNSNSNNHSQKAVFQSGSWDLPSLDEVVQEGVIGLTRAVDKYEPKRGHKFSTYATHWITSYIRQCFRNASTGCLRVPMALHQIKADHAKLIKQCYDMNVPPPPVSEIAKQIGVNTKRLNTALRATQTLLSMDAAVYTGSQSGKGSSAGGDNGDSGLVFSDSMQCPEPKPEDYVELSILRQCLENAMAAELSPHERDVIRLRLGLDDGQSRTVREVVEVCGGTISMADVRSAERRAFKKLRAPNTAHAHNLMAFLDYTDVGHNNAYSQRGRR